MGSILILYLFIMYLLDENVALSTGFTEKFRTDMNALMDAESLNLKEFTKLMCGGLGKVLDYAKKLEVSQ